MRNRVRYPRARQALLGREPLGEERPLEQSEKRAVLLGLHSGEYPENHDFYNEAGEHIGEWRADGRQTVFSGIHPEGMAYRNSGNPPAELEHSEIVFPPGILTARPRPSAVEIAAPNLEEEEEPFDDTALTTKCGGPYEITKRGVILNQSYFAQRFCLENKVIFELEENWFYTYRRETGAWHKTMPQEIREMFRRDWEHMVHLFNEPKLEKKNTSAFNSAILKEIESHSARSKAFPRLKKEGVNGIIHCTNGMLHLIADGDVNRRELWPFSPDYMSRNPIPVAWEPEAKAPKFEAILGTLPPADASLIMRYFGNILLGGNKSHGVLVLVGEGGTSKSTLCEVIELLLGRRNFIELRTKFLLERFEIARYAGKLLLSGKDVPGTFLQEEGAQALKKLTGHDSLSGEAKFSNAEKEVYGDYACVVTCNERLLVRLEGEIDITAWARRLLIVPFGPECKHKEIIQDYAQQLIAEEGPGILVLIVRAAFEHLRELADPGALNPLGGKFTLSPAQVTRVEALLAESISLEKFAKERVFKDPEGPGLSTEEITVAYTEYCEDRGWAPLELRTVRIRLPDIMSRQFQSHLGKNIKRTNEHTGKEHMVRGYPRVALAEASEEEAS